MEKEFIRALPATFDVEGRTLHGRALTWDKPYAVSDDGVKWYKEGFRRTTFTTALKGHGNVFELRAEHLDKRVGRVTFSEETEGLAFTAPVDESDLGDQALDLVRSGKVKGVSIRYTSHKQRMSHDGIVWRLQATPRELSLTESPQFNDAQIEHVRRYVALYESARALLCVDPYSL